jgi:hypothetical protein
VNINFAQPSYPFCYSLARRRSKRELKVLKRGMRDKAHRCPRKSCSNWRRLSRFTQTPWSHRFLELRLFQIKLLPLPAGSNSTAPLADRF